MRRVLGTVALAVAVLALRAGALAEDRPPVREPDFPTGGSFEIRGQEVKHGVLRLEMSVQPLVGGVHALGGVEVYAEPSHTLLFAAVDPARLGPGGVAAIAAERPAARLEGNLGAELSPMVTIRFGPSADTRIRVDYVLVGSDGTRVRYTVRDVTVGKLSRFAFKTGPSLGAPGDGMITGTCAIPPGQASIDCPGPRVTMCCLDSPCWIACGDSPCPRKEGEVR
jgi:hypothetical protein